MEPTPVSGIDSIEYEDGVLFNVTRVNINSYDPYEAKDFVKHGFCKVIMKIDNSVTKTSYFKNGIETSKETIIQDERINQLRR